MIAGPGHQLLDLVPGMTVEDGAERLVDVVEGIDAVQLAGRHEGGEHGPVFSAHIVAREERILSCECHHPFIQPMSATNVKFIIAGIRILA